MESKLDQAAIVLEGALSQKSEEQIFQTYMAMNLDQMLEANRVMHANLTEWSEDVLDAYKERITNYELVNEALNGLKGKVMSEAISAAGVQAATNNYHSIKAEFSSILKLPDQDILPAELEKKKEVFEGILLPHYMMMRFLFGTRG